MKLKYWYKPKAYTHLTPKIGIHDIGWIENYVSQPETVARHSFYPLIHKTVANKRYKKVANGIDDKPVKAHYIKEGDVRKSTVKYREIFYANHLDAHVYSYYTKTILEPKYENQLKNNGLQDCVLAYRRIAVQGEDRCKCNIDFANDVFEEIKKSGGEISVLALDISKFFDSLNHKQLKRAWAKLLGSLNLPEDHYTLYKNVTRFSYVELKDILNEFDLSHPNEIIQEEIESFAMNGLDFRERIKNKGLIKKNPFRRNGEMVGIPQGTPISAFLANLYLLEFDNDVLRLLEPIKGIYRRYSDDILIICPRENTKDVEREIMDTIKKYKLVIQPDKTQRTVFINGKLQKGEKPVTYLGFQFDGRRKLLKPASLSKFYRKMKSSVKYRAYRAKLARVKIQNKGTSIDSTIRRKPLYDQFSFLGASNDNKLKRNFIAYANFSAKIMNEPVIKRQLSNAWGILHQQIRKYERRYDLKTPSEGN